MDCLRSYFLFSTGVTIWEMLTFGAHPYHGKPIEDMLKSLENGQRLQQPVTVTADLYSILVECKNIYCWNTEIYCTV